MKKTALILMTFAGTLVYSQNSRPKDIKDAPEIKERIANNGHKAKPAIQVSQYHGLDAKISSLFSDNKIPADCPTGTNYSDKSKYIEVLNKWITENQDKVSDDKKNVFISQ